MARKVETLTITEEGRDKGKVFILTEMAATAGERWATEALFLLSKAGLELPADAAESGMSGLASAPLGGLPSLRALQDPALDAWRECVKYQHDPRHLPQNVLWDHAACQIEEIATVNMLRMKVLELHLGFFINVSPSTTG